MLLVFQERNLLATYAKRTHETDYGVQITQGGLRRFFFNIDDGDRYG